ncbi:MAG: hemerythrin domain-containing protein [Neisseriaceae bacterium]|jgi:hemerythrin superfamily protein
MDTNTFEPLITDHKEVKSIIEEILNTTNKDKQKRRDLLHNLKEELTQHERIEEDSVYPILEKKKLTHNLTKEAYEEHHVVDILLDELEALDFSDESWKAKLKVLQKSLLHHIKVEEDELFVKAEKELSKEELNTIKDDIIEAKENG